MIKVCSKSLFFNHSLTGKALLIIILIFSCYPQTTFAQKPFKIVIDAGHGGKDPGRPNKSGIKEKDIVLNIALDLGKKLENSGNEVIYTRKKDIFLCDSGGQYKYGTTDVTRTICFSKPKKNIKNIFTRVLKGHIAVVSSELNKNTTGKILDVKARKFLKEINLDYGHGTGHGVGFFSNVHEGPQAISKFNKIKIREGMILSNEPGYYKKDKFGIRIENLMYVKKNKNKLYFENLTLAPIDNDLINFNLLTNNEKNYLLKYNINIYSKLYKHLNVSEKKWLASFIQ